MIHPRRAELTLHRMPVVEHGYRAWSLSRALAEVWICALGLLSSVSIHLVGDFFATEVILIACLPFLLMIRGRLVSRRLFSRVFMMLGLWLLSQILTDIYRRTELQNRMRGTANIVFFMIEIACVGVLLTSERRKVLFLTSYATGQIFMARLIPNSYTLTDEWKWGYSNGITMLALIVACWFYVRRRYVPVLVLFGIIGSIDLLDNYRSALLELMVAAVLVVPVFPEQMGRIRLLPRKRGLAHVLIVVSITLAAGWSANQLVMYATKAGLLGEDAKAKNEREARAGNLILGGRPEVFIGLRAALDSPILGHGSWARDMKYAEMAAHMFHTTAAATVAEGVREARGVIPAHSHLVQAWVFAGIVGAIFWAYLLWLVLRAILRVAVYRPSLAPVYAWLLATYAWAILFSPFGSTSRLIEAATITIIVDLLDPGRLKGMSSSIVAREWTRSGALAERRALV